MKKINFKQFKMFTDIAHERTTVVDVSRDLADAVYKNANGLMALDLAMRIYKSEGEVEMSEEEVAFLEKFVSANSAPIFIDSLKANIYD